MFLVGFGWGDGGFLEPVPGSDCAPDSDSIDTALQQLYSSQFQNNLGLVENPYEKGGASKTITSVLRKHPLNDILKKKFYDVVA